MYGGEEGGRVIKYLGKASNGKTLTLLFKNISREEPTLEGLSGLVRLSIEDMRERWVQSSQASQRSKVPGRNEFLWSKLFRSWPLS